jgi:cell pole-organizing protein PopZ
MHTKNGNTENNPHRHLKLVPTTEQVASMSSPPASTLAASITADTPLHRQVTSSSEPSLRDIAKEERYAIEQLSKRGAAVDSATHALNNLQIAGVSNSAELKDVLSNINQAISHLKDHEPEQAIERLQPALIFLQQIPTKVHPLKGASRLLRETLDELLKATNEQLDGDPSVALGLIETAEAFEIEACRRVVDCYITSTAQS